MVLLCVLYMIATHKKTKWCSNLQYCDVRTCTCTKGLLSDWKTAQESVFILLS